MTRGSPSETCGDHGGRNNDGSPCGRAAGWGTDFDTGKCRGCRGTNPDGTVPDDHGAPENNGNAAKHNLHADRGKLYERMSETKQQRVDMLERALIERYEEFHGREPDAMDVSDFFEIAMSTIQREFAREYMAEQMDETGNPVLQEVELDVGEDESITFEQAHDILDKMGDLRREDRLMKKHMGLFRDPETKQAEATATLAEVINGE